MVFVVAGLLFVFSCLGSASTAQATELTFVDYDTPTSLSGFIGTAIKEEIGRHTDGEVTVKIFWGTSLLKGPESLEGVQDGVIDMGIINPNYYPNKLPMNGVYAVFPQGPKSYESLAWLYKVIFDRVPELKQELLENNQVPLLAFSVMPKTVASTKPIASIADFKGKKMRAANRWALSQLEAAGAIPVSVPWSDCYMALETGTIDAVYTNHDSVHAAKLDEVGPNVFLLPQLWSGTKFMITINKDRWDGFSPETREQIMTAMNVVNERYGKEFEKKWQDVVDEMVEIGYTVNQATDEEIAEFVNLPAMAEIQEVWITEREKEGVKDARAIFEKVKTTVEEALAREKN
jgi:TRAP-type C4-dicarboxylate transport system substrate-binding protein